MSQQTRVLFDILMLPNELIYHVASFLDRYDLAAFVWCNSYMSNLLAPLLYRDRTVSLIIAARTWKPQVIKLLVNRFGARPRDIVEHRTGNLLHIAISSIFVDIHENSDRISLEDTINLLIQLGVQINYRCSIGSATPLIFATKNHIHHCLNNEIVKTTLVRVVNLLLEAGADAEAVDDDGRTVVHYAARQICPQVLKVLLDRKVKANTLDNLGNAPIHLALEGLLDSSLVCKAVSTEDVINKDIRLDIIRILASSGSQTINIQARDCGYTPLHRAIRPAAPHHFCQGQYAFGRAVATLLLSLGANPTIPDCKGRTPLHLAAARGDFLWVEVLGQKPAIDVRMSNKIGDTPLHYAIRNVGCQCDLRVLRCRRAAMVQTLLQLGADPNSQNLDGETPLQVSMGQDCNLLVDRLLARGARIDTQDRTGATPLRVMAEQKNDKLLKKFLEYANKDGKGCEIMDTPDGNGDTVWNAVKGVGKKKIMGMLNEKYRRWKKSEEDLLSQKQKECV
jgi:ankyrin repeat protein